MDLLLLGVMEIMVAMLETYLGLDNTFTTFHVNCFDPEAVPLLQSGVKLISATYGAFSAVTWRK